MGQESTANWKYARSPKNCNPINQSSNVWLMHAPVGIAEQTWLVVCLCALNAMDMGRRKLLSLRLQGRETDGDDPEYGAPVRRSRGRARVAAPIHSNVERVEMAKGIAVSEFWGRVADWKALTRPPEGIG